MTRPRVIALTAALVFFTSVPVLLWGEAAFAAPATTTTLSSTPAVTGQSVTFTAKVTPKTGTTPPTGTVTFTITPGDGSPAPICDGGTDAITPLTNSGSSALAHCTFSAGLFHAASPYMVSAAYSEGDDGSSSVGPVNKAIGLGPTTTHVSSSSNPSSTGQSVSFMATVAAASPATGNPPGSVTFTITPGDGSTPPTCDGGNDTFTLSSDTASCTLSSGLDASGSPYKVGVTYTDNSNNYASSTTTGSQKVGKAPATLTVTSMAGNGSGPANTAVTGEPVSFTATVSNAGTLTGSVVFSLVGNDVPSPTCSGGDTISISGQAHVTCSVPNGLQGRGLNYTVAATLEDPNYAAMGSLVETVNPAGTSIALAQVPIGKLAFQSFKLKATVTSLAPGAGIPGGIISFGYCVPNGTKCWGGPVVLSSSMSTAPNSVTAVWNVPTGRGAGSYTVTATYQGNSNFFASQSGQQVLAIAKNSATMYLQSSHDPAGNSEGVTLKAALLPPAGVSYENGPPTGTVKFTITDKNGATYLCQGSTTNVMPLDTNKTTQGIASCIIPSGTLQADDSPFTVKAGYSGDANYHGASKTITQTVVS